MNKNQKVFFTTIALIFIVALLGSLSYNQYQGMQIKRRQEALQNIFSVPSVEKQKEKGFFTKIKESIFGTEEEKLEKEMKKKMEKVLELETKYDKADKIDEKAIMEYRTLAKEMEELQNKYYRLTGQYYEGETENTPAKIEKQETKEIKEQKPVEEVSLEKRVEEKIVSSYIEQGYMEKKPGIFQKLVGFFQKSNARILEKEKEEIKIEPNENSIYVKVSKEGKLTKELKYLFSEEGEVIKLEEKNLEEAYTIKLDNIESGKAIKEYDNGEKIEYFHKNQIPIGKAVKYFPDGDREEFYYQNGVKNGLSLYYFKNGDREEVHYKDGKIEGKARYIYGDGYIEKYEYKDGKRVE